MMKCSVAVPPLAALAILAACAETTGVAPELAPATRHASLTDAQVVATARGSAPLEIAGELRTFTFNAKQHADGSVSGEFQIIARQVDRVTHGRITCMTVLGKSAWLGGIIERDDSGVSTGAEARFRVVDLGQAPGGSPDLVSLLNFIFVPGAAQSYCNAIPSFPALMPTDGGELTVNQPGSASFTTSTTIPADVGVFVPCAIAGQGEFVQLSGTLHILSHFTESAAGGFRAMTEINPQGISGYGAASGDKYQGTGMTRSSFDAGPLPITQTFVNNFRIIGEGTGNNLLIHSTFHVTVNAGGVLTAFVDNFSSECR
ncbi:MAG: hypothetical protein ACREOK_16225 [Gemmatimonadaceae bacterium]